MSNDTNLQFNTPLISVIVPIYNVEPYLRDCIDSLLSQNYQDFELILVDDESPDNCPKICDWYAAMDPRVKVVHKQNGGLVSARKAGCAVATGEYIANVDGDDGVSPIFFAKLDDVIKSYGPDIIQFQSTKVYSDKTVDEAVDIRMGYYNTKDIRNEIYPRLIEDKKGRGITPAVWSYLIRRSIYTKCQNQVLDTIKIGEDWACSKPAWYMAQSAYVISDHLYLYRSNYDSMTRNKNAFDISVPKQIGQVLEGAMDMSECDFEDQKNRMVVHHLFNACASQFYLDKPYEEICDSITEALKDEYYQNAIRNCRYSIFNIKGRLALCGVKNKAYKSMKMYCKSRLKNW